MKPFDLFSNAVRAKEIAAVLIRNGFADFVQKLEPPASWLRRFTPRVDQKFTTWERIRIVLEELGPTYVKFGQMLSMRPDVLPEPLILELRKLQDSVKAEPFEVLEPVLREGLDEELDAVFSEFDRKSVASASLAQVYFARLKSTGEAVAVKVQRPDIARIIDADFEILRWFVRQLHQRVDDLRPYDLPAIADELHDGIERELDFRTEARNAAYFLMSNPDAERVFAPRPIEAFSSRAVLVMERVEGGKLDTLASGSAAACQLAATGAQSIFHQILVTGFFHADPHGGNMVVASDGRLCFLDWGLVGQLTRRMRYTLLELFGAFLQGDAAQVVRVAGDLGRASRSRADSRNMERQILYALRDTFDPATGQGNLGRALLRLMHIFGENGVDIGRDYALVAKAVLSIEEAGMKLDPNFNLRESFKPAVDALIRERRDPRLLWQAFRQGLNSGVGRLQELPGELYRVLRMLEEGSATINFQHRGLEDLDDAINDASNKVTLAVIIGSLIIGSSLIVKTGVGPTVFGYSAIGIFGYLLSALLGVWVIFDILRGGKRR